MLPSRRSSAPVLRPRHASVTSPVRRLVAALLAFGLIVIGPAAAQEEESIGDIRRSREAARDEEAAALKELELLELEDERIGEIVAQIQLAVDNQTAQVQAARQQLQAAEAEVAARESAAAAATEHLVTTRQATQDRAVDAFVGTNREFEPWLASNDLNRTAIRLAMIDFAAGSDRDALDDLRTIEAEREAHLRAGEEARAEADALRATLEEELAELETRKDVQRRIQEELQGRIAEWERQAAELARDAEELTELIRQKQTQELGFNPGDPGSASVEGFIMPIEGRVGSGFGSRVHPIFRTTRMHSGVDIGATTGQAIWAAKAGVVIFAGVKGGYGNAVIIQHEGNVATLYAHMSELRSSDGDQVEAGDLIGLAGSTGWSTGPHLHFETRVDGVPKNPELFLPG